MAAAPYHLAAWTGAAIDDECRSAYAAYRKAKVARYEEYFAGKPERRDEPTRTRPATSRRRSRRGGTRSPRSSPIKISTATTSRANSSQVLALGLLGAAAQSDPSLAWLWNALDGLPAPHSDRPEWRFEDAVSPELLNERPRQTSIDFWAEDDETVMCLEAKWD